MSQDFQDYLDQSAVDHARLDKQILLDYINDKLINDDIIQWFVTNTRVNMSDYDIVYKFMSRNYETYAMRYINLELYSDDQTFKMHCLACMYGMYTIVDYLLDNGITFCSELVFLHQDTQIMEIILNHDRILFHTGCDFYSRLINFCCNNKNIIDPKILYKFILFTCDEFDLYQIFYATIVCNMSLFHEFVSDNFVTSEIFDRIKTDIGQILLDCTDESIIDKLMQMRILVPDYIDKYYVNYNLKKKICSISIISKTKRANSSAIQIN